MDQVLSNKTKSSTKVLLLPNPTNQTWVVLLDKSSKYRLLYQLRPFCMLLDPLSHLFGYSHIFTGSSMDLHPSYRFRNIYSMLSLCSPQTGQITPRPLHFWAVFWKKKLCKLASHWATFRGASHASTRSTSGSWKRKEVQVAAPHTYS